MQFVFAFLHNSNGSLTTDTMDLTGRLAQHHAILGLDKSAAFE